MGFVDEMAVFPTLTNHLVIDATGVDAVLLLDHCVRAGHGGDHALSGYG